MREPYMMTLANGTQLELRYSFKALRFLEKHTGGHFFSDSVSRIGTEYISAGIAAGLLWKIPDITPSKVDNLIEAHLDAGGELPSVLDGLVEALKRSGILKRDAAEEQSPGERPTLAPAPAEQ